MDLHKAEQMAIKAFHEHGLAQAGWRFQWTTAKRTLGVCRHHSKTIGMSRVLVLLNDEAQTQDTILHEVAHALVGPGAGHGPVWRAKARQIGCNGQRQAADAVTPEAKWTGTCPNGHVAKRHRLTEKARGVACGTCCRTLNRGRWTAAYLFDWKENINA